MRYDAAIIGAGADGLAAAATLAKSGLKVILIERGETPGGRCKTLEFHPGFHASPFCDELPPIPVKTFWALDLARRGAVFVPSPTSSALWPDRVCSFQRGEVRLFERVESLRRAVLERAEAEVLPKRKSLPLIGRRLESPPWPGGGWAGCALTDLVAAEMMGADRAALTMAQALAGRVAHPDHTGTSLHLLAVDDSGLVVGGLQRLGDALTTAARESGAEISCGLEVTDIRHVRGKVTGLCLADGAEIEARAVISTLDLKRTFLSLFAWNDLPRDMADRVATFRMAGCTARILFALDKLPDRPAPGPDNLFHGPVHIAPDRTLLASAYSAWRSGTLSNTPPIALRFFTDPRLCPPGRAVMTATVGCVPLRLFDGAWTHDKRDALRARVLIAIESVFSGIAGRILASKVLVPPDIEEGLGCTDGDILGGDIAPDQMLGLRPWLDGGGARTQFHGLYLAGPSTSAGALGTCAAGVLAAETVRSDLIAGLLR